MKENKQLTQALKQDEEESLHRQFRLDQAATGDNQHGSDILLPGYNQHKPAEATAHISQKYYFFPPAFNALRQELEQHWARDFTEVDPEMKVSLAHAMVFDAPTFVGLMNKRLDDVVQFDSENVQGICEHFLNRLRVFRGVSKL
jgi:hypothetical protein